MRKQEDNPAILIRKIKNAQRLCIRQNRLYIYKDRFWQSMSEREVAIVLRRLSPEKERDGISLSDIKEAYGRLLQDPGLQRTFTEENEQNFLNLFNGVFDIENECLLNDQDDFDFGYSLAFSYINEAAREMPNFEKYVNSAFPNETEIKRKLLLQIMAYCISDYTIAKKGFFLIGASNSGKSLLLNLVKRVLPENMVTNISLDRLSNRFNLAKLADSRLNICSELSENSFSASDVFKMLTSNERVTAEHKGQNPFEFCIRCKSLNAGNMIPEIKNIEGMDAMLTRMVILMFPYSVSEEDKDLELPEKLWMERDSIFSAALDELVELRKNNFVFAEPQDTKGLKSQMASLGNAFEDFLSDCCVREEGAKEHMRDLYDEFRRYCDSNLLDVKISQNQFTQKIARLDGIKKGKFRLSGGNPASGVYGIRLKFPNENQFYTNT